MRRSLLEELLRRHPELDEREARGRILRGDVAVGGERMTKPGYRVAEDEPIVVRPRPRFVSRAGEKLEDALCRLELDVRGKVMIDAGSSTGGFTDCLLARGAAAVHCVDVGRGQLAWRLRRDPRVRVLEGTNVMDLRAAELTPPPHAAVCDLSFRSIRGAASHLVSLTSESWLLALVKPQFEWSRPPDSFRGVVRGEVALAGILDEVAADLAREGLVVAARCPSALPGRKGNREWFYLIRRARPTDPPETAGKGDRGS